MKFIVLSTMICASLFTAPSVRAEVIVYKGTARVTYIGQNSKLQLNFKLYLVVDRDHTNVGELFYSSFHGQKMYSNNTETNLHFVEVSGPGASVYTAVTQPPSECDTNSGSTSEGVFLRGITTTLTINTNSPVYFPRTVTSIESSYDSSPPASLANGTITAAFDQKDTLISNGAGDDVDAALARFVTALQSQGYSQASKSVRKTNGRLAGHAARMLTAAGIVP